MLWQRLACHQSIQLDESLAVEVVEPCKVTQGDRAAAKAAALAQLPSVVATQAAALEARRQVARQLLSVLRRPRLGGGSGRSPRQVPPAHIGRPLLGWAVSHSITVTHACFSITTPTRALDDKLLCHHPIL